MKTDKQALINNVEFAIDYGLPVTENDMQAYLATVYQKGRADARQEAVESSIRRRRKKLDKLKTRAICIALMILLIFASLVTQDATLLMVFVPVIFIVILKGE